jgi:hypothetical protein
VRVAIVCTCAEPGRDGVGDYSFRLAAGIAGEGHEAVVIAVNDHLVAGPEPVSTTHSGVRVIRLPAVASEEQRGAWLSKELAAFVPGWVLLQFVCWGFADRGILDPPPKGLIAALSGHRVAVYCHELWLGLERGATLRHRWWGRRQRASILRLLSLLRPLAVLTSNRVYSAVLERFGWKARIVPLVSNIPVYDGATAALRQLLEQRAARLPWKAREQAIVLAVFGTVFPGWEPEPALRWLRAEAERRGRHVVLISIGRPSRWGEELLERHARNVGISSSTVVLGEAGPEAVSGLLQEADIGLPSNGWMLLGKSGVAAAMQAHGLPMLVVRQERAFRDLEDLSVSHPPSVFRFDAAAPAPDFDALVGARARAVDTLPDVTRQLIAALDNRGPGSPGG